MTTKPTGSSTSTVKPTSKPTANPTVKPTGSSLPQFLQISNQALGWGFRAGKPFSNEPATLSATLQQVADKYDAVWKLNKGSGPVVYITMDEGYEYGGNTSRILDTAAQKNVKVAFFVTGTYVRDNSALIRRMVREGHTVLNHTWSHPDLQQLQAKSGDAAILSELQRVEAIYSQITGKVMAKYVRPPSGCFSERVLAVLRHNGYRAVFWSFAYKDWDTAKQPQPEIAKNRILGSLFDGSVILLHAVSNTNASIWGELIDAIRARGYRIGDLGQVLP